MTYEAQFWHPIGAFYPVWKSGDSEPPTFIVYKIVAGIFIQEDSLGDTDLWVLVSSDKKKKKR